MYSLSPLAEDLDWTCFDSNTKRTLTFFDDVSSCIRKDVFQEINFSPLINAEDIDFGTKLLARRKPIAYLSSTGVYHWHDKGGDDLFKRNYLGTKAHVYTLKNHLPHFYTIHQINWQCIAEAITGLYTLIITAIAGLGKIDARPINSIKAFVEQLSKGMEASPDDLERVWEQAVDDHNNGLYALINEMFKDVNMEIEGKYNFKQNFLLPY